MKKKVPLILGITIPTCLVVLLGVGIFVFVQRKNNDKLFDIPDKTSISETKPNETTSSETGASDASNSHSENYKSLEDIRKVIAQNKSKIISGDTSAIDSGYSKYLEYLVHIDKRFGLHYFAPEGMYIRPKKDNMEYYKQVAAKYQEPFFESSDTELVCATKDGKQSLFIIVNKIKNSEYRLNSNGTRNIGGQNFIDASKGGWRLYCRQVGDYVITIATTSDSLLSGFVS